MNSVSLILYFCFRKLKSCIKNAKNSLDICLLLITLEDVAAEIILAHQRNVKVRIISDAQMSVTKGSKMDTFRTNGKMLFFKYALYWGIAVYFPN